MIRKPFLYITEEVIGRNMEHRCQSKQLNIRYRAFPNFNV